MQQKYIKILVDTDQLIDFFKGDSSWGTADKPLVADAFCHIDAPDIHWEGNNILPLEPATDYTLSLDDSSAVNKVVLFDSATGDIKGQIFIDMITHNITKEKEWGQVFDLSRTNYEVTLDGHLILKPTADNLFKVGTPEKINLHQNIFYKIVFRIDGADKMAVIDPLIKNNTPG